MPEETCLSDQATETCRACGMIKNNPEAICKFCHETGDTGESWEITCSHCEGTGLCPILAPLRKHQQIIPSSSCCGARVTIIFEIIGSGDRSEDCILKGICHSCGELVFQSTLEPKDLVKQYTKQQQ